jgi:hypothetical protein
MENQRKKGTFVEYPLDSYFFETEGSTSMKSQAEE